MRLDYVLYALAIICFIVTGAVAAYAATQQLWIVTTAVIGLAFIGIGYTQRPREEPQQAMAVSPPPPPPTLPTPKPAEIKTETKMPETKVETPTIPTVQIEPPSVGLLDVKGIKDKRALQLKAIGINSVEDLAKASPTELAAKLKIAPYFTGKWIESAKEILKKS
jgi:predicted flap endonuclease-1-like 5' DNA nuclease